VSDTGHPRKRILRAVGKDWPALTGVLLVFLSKFNLTSNPVRYEPLMADRSTDTWYVSFEPKKLPGKRHHPRVTETFQNENEAKKFARRKMADTLNISAGTLNPHLPKRIIPSKQIVQWLLELD
jgi:hypothetical protein